MRSQTVKKVSQHDLASWDLAVLSGARHHCQALQQ
jgi:hypothetical protein